MTRNTDISDFKFIAASVSIFVSVLIGPTEFTAAQACGWWGDGEMSKHGLIDLATSGGRRIPAKLDRDTIKLPQQAGYGFAVLDPGEAVPVMKATHGRPVTRIGEFRSFGFDTVVDIGTPLVTARLHQAETEAAGMRYVSIPVDSDLPSPHQMHRFRKAVLGASEKPVLVYAPRASLLAVMWTSYRLGLGAPRGYAFSEGRSLGLLPGQEAMLSSLPKSEIR